ncbi:hypothetical protein PanWU01x14_235840 [Parasponia andersonii]|uniref:Uncharacterized protein n=1 Tax=Parasponia andersonii TaxID=3476 RepID=A0A2P5BIU3_PARAD|nr:hypothetical protein PanWU01x14_235840 [Parasponia andersonii]
MACEKMPETIVSVLQAFGRVLKASRDVLDKAVGMAVLEYTLMSVPVPRTICSKIDVVIHDFWWGIDRDKQHLYLKSWESSCKPKNRGGLGFQQHNQMYI